MSGDFSRALPELLPRHRRQVVRLVIRHLALPQNEDDLQPLRAQRPERLAMGVTAHRQLALENLALRHQLAVYKRTVARPRLRRTDRLLWVWLARVWTGWRAALVIVTPATVLRWQRRRFRAHWTKLSRRP